MAMQITDETFGAEVLKSELPVIVDFSATWCGPCRMIAPYMEQIAEEYQGKAKVVKVDIDKCPNLSAKFGIRNVPTILYFKNGQVVDKHIGAASKQIFVDKLKKFL